MLKIRLQRVGRKNHAEFRIVVTESTRPAKSPNCVELLGNYNPHTNSVELNAERITYWISKGAQPSDTVHNMLVAKKVIEGTKRNVLPKKTPIKKPETEEKKEAVQAESTEPVAA